MSFQRAVITIVPGACKKTQIADDKCCICGDMLTNLIEQSVEMGKCHS